MRRIDQPRLTHFFLACLCSHALSCCLALSSSQSQYDWNCGPWHLKLDSQTALQGPWEYVWAFSENPLCIKNRVRPLYILPCRSSQYSCKLGDSNPSSLHSILQMRKLGPREAKKFTEAHRECSLRIVASTVPCTQAPGNGFNGNNDASLSGYVIPMTPSSYLEYCL